MIFLKYILLIIFYLSISILCSYSYGVEGDRADAIIKKYKNYIVKPSKNTKCIQYLKINGEGYCTTVSIKELEQPNVESPKERISFIFDDRKWKKTWWNCDEFSCGIEYILEDDDINNWKELVTTQFTKTSNVPIDLYYTKFVEGISAFQPKEKIKYNVIKKSQGDILFEFQITNPSNIQDELHRAISTKYGLYIFRYTVKKPDMGNELRAKWIKIISNASIKH